MKTMCPHKYHHNGFVTTHSLGYMIYSVQKIKSNFVFYVSTSLFYEKLYI